MYEKRQKHYPTFPKSLDEAIDQLKNLHENDFFKFKGNHILYYMLYIRLLFNVYMLYNFVFNYPILNQKVNMVNLFYIYHYPNL